MSGPELVEDISCIKASVVTQLSGNDLQCFCIGSYQQLLLAWDGPGIVPQIFGQLHFYSTATSHNRVILQSKDYKLGLSRQVLI